MQEEFWTLHPQATFEDPYYNFEAKEDAQHRRYREYKIR